MTNDEIIEELEAKTQNIVSEKGNNFIGYHESEHEKFKSFLLKVASLSRQEGVREVLGKVGFLRQALNEDRITDPKKMIDDEYIKHWLR